VLYLYPERYLLFPADYLSTLSTIGNQPSIFISVSGSQGNGGIGLVASRRTSMGIFGPDGFNGVMT